LITLTIIISDSKLKNKQLEHEMDGVVGDWRAAKIF